MCSKAYTLYPPPSSSTQDHLAGKQYQGWKAIREKLVQLQEKYAARAAEDGEIQAQEEASLRGQPSMDRSRSRERSSRSRERSRERDGYRPRSRCGKGGEVVQRHTMCTGGTSGTETSGIGTAGIEMTATAGMIGTGMITAAGTMTGMTGGGTERGLQFAFTNCM